MKNWMEKFEERKDELNERELNIKLEKLLDLLDEAYKDKDRIMVLEEIIKTYDEFKNEFYDYDEEDYLAKKKELAEIRYKIKKQEHINTIEAQSWNEYQKEEREEDEEER